MKKDKVGNIFVEGIKKALSEGKTFKVDRKAKSIIESLVKEALEDELERYLETEDDEYEGREGIGKMTDDFLDEMDEINDNYNIDISQLDDDDEIVITIDKEGNVAIDKIETAEGDEFSAEELEDVGVIERKVKKEGDTHGVSRKAGEMGDKKKKVKYYKDEEDERKYPKTVGSGNVSDKLYENVEITGADFTIDPDAEVVVDDKGNVEFVDDYDEGTELSGDDIELGDEEEVSADDMDSNDEEEL